MIQTLVIKNNKITLITLLAGIALSFFFYIYCVNSAVRNVVSMNQVNKEAAQTDYKVSELEYRYMLESSLLTLESARSLGLSELGQKVFISRTDSKRSLSFKR